MATMMKEIKPKKKLLSPSGKASAKKQTNAVHHSKARQ
jgi:hypothetical protein